MGELRPCFPRQASLTGQDGARTALPAMGGAGRAPRRLRPPATTPYIGKNEGSLTPKGLMRTDPRLRPDLRP